MDLQERIGLLVRLGEYMQNGDNEFQFAKENAYLRNSWFIPEFVDHAINNIATHFLQGDTLLSWTKGYAIKAAKAGMKKVGIVMAGNIPLVGFHDLLCVFVSGNNAVIRPSSKDEVLIKQIVQKMTQWEAGIQNHISFADTLKGCDAYIATGSNNSGRYFEYYFAKYPSIIRRNKTSVAILDGSETNEELERLADDIQLYFGLGCRNVTKLYVPKGYDFVPLLHALKKYDYFMEFHKYKNNYDYQLTLLMMNNRYYMANGSVIFAENESLFAPVSQVNYQFYKSKGITRDEIGKTEEIQCMVGHGLVNFSEAQSPGLGDYADGIDTMAFLSVL